MCIILYYIILLESKNYSNIKYSHKSEFPITMLRVHTKTWEYYIIKCVISLISKNAMSNIVLLTYNSHIFLANETIDLYVDNSCLTTH